MNTTRCPTCDGRGQTRRACQPVACPACNGTGQRPAELMLDLCSGLGGASAAMRDRGWRVVTLDSNPEFTPDIVADVRTWQWGGARPDLIWASPPCIEFARESMPWSRTGTKPDMSIVRACYRIIQDVQPRFWIIENVRGAIPYLEPLMGSWKWHSNGVFLWGHFPDLGRPVIRKRKKESFSSTQRAERAMIPYALSQAVAVAIESQPMLLPAEQAGHGRRNLPPIDHETALRIINKVAGL